MLQPGPPPWRVCSIQPMRAALALEVDRLLDAAAPDESARAPKLLVVPHAGYVYSGPVAAQAYALLAPWREQIRRVVLLGPTHRVAVRGLALPTVAAFETPLGRVALDSAALARLRELPQVTPDDDAHTRRSIRSKCSCRSCSACSARSRCVPLAVGDASAAEVAQVLERAVGRRRDADRHQHRPVALPALRRGARQGPRDGRAHPAPGPRLSTTRQACGATPLAGALLAARAHGLVPRLLDLRNSGDTAGDRSRVVGYCAHRFRAARQARDERARTQAAGSDDARRGARCRADRPCAQRDRRRACACRPHRRAAASRAGRAGRHLRDPAAWRRVARLRRHARRPSARWPTMCGCTRWRRRFAIRASSRCVVEEFAATRDRGLAARAGASRCLPAARPRRTPRCGPASTA